MSLWSWLQGKIRRAPSGQIAVSSNYVGLGADEGAREAERLRCAWHDDQMPARQRALAEQQLAAFARGEPVDVYDCFVKAICELPDAAPGASLLEIGCSSGYYAEVVKIAGLNVAYHGCDYAPAFVEMARARHPATPFDVQDATALAYGDNSFDIVVSGCCLLHIPEFKQAICETARVARRYAIFHRTPVVTDRPTQYYRKQAYGVETIEIHFNEEEFLGLLRQAGLHLLQTMTLETDASVQKDGRPRNAMRTYVLEKRAHKDEQRA